MADKTFDFVAEMARIWSFLDRCEEEGNCLVWTGTLSSIGYPTVYESQAGKVFLAKRYALWLAGRMERDDPSPVQCLCGNRRCVAPSHHRPSTIREIAQRAAKAGAFSSLQRRMAISRGVRASGVTKLTLEAAREIRLSGDPSQVLAGRYGVSRSLINRIRANEVWRETAASNPFAGLMA